MRLTQFPSPGVRRSTRRKRRVLSLGLHRNQRDIRRQLRESYLLKTFRRSRRESIQTSRSVAFSTSKPIITDPPRFSASLNTADAGKHRSRLGVLHSYVTNQGDGWQSTLDQLSQYFERVAALPREEDYASLSSPNEAGNPMGRRAARCRVDRRIYR